METKLGAIVKNNMRQLGADLTPAELTSRTLAMEPLSPGEIDRALPQIFNLLKERGFSSVDSAAAIKGVIDSENRRETSQARLNMLSDAILASGTENNESLFKILTDKKGAAAAPEAAVNSMYSSIVQKSENDDIQRYGSASLLTSEKETTVINSIKSAVSKNGLDESVVDKAKSKREQRVADEKSAFEIYAKLTKESMHPVKSSDVVTEISEKTGWDASKITSVLSSNTFRNTFVSDPNKISQNIQDGLLNSVRFKSSIPAGENTSDYVAEKTKNALDEVGLKPPVEKPKVNLSGLLSNVLRREEGDRGDGSHVAGNSRDRNLQHGVEK